MRQEEEETKPKVTPGAPTQPAEEEEEEKKILQGARKIIPEDIVVPQGFRVEAFATGLTTPINLLFTPTGQMLIADAGITDNNGKVLRLTGRGLELVADGFNPPLTGINYHEGNIYVSHRGFITIIKPDGSKEDILGGLPSFGDHHNNRVIFGPDGKMYFGQGTATNSGVVGQDNTWVRRNPLFHDYPGEDIVLLGKNFPSANFLSAAPNDAALTGGFSPFGVPNYPRELVKGITKAAGSILRANPDGSNLELVAWGLRNPFRMLFDRQNRLFSTNHGMDVRGSRPVDNSPDEFWNITPNTWYGWPDYTGGLPVTLPQFKAEGRPQPTFLLARHPMKPPTPLAVFAPHAAIMGFDFNYNPSFGPMGDVFIAEFGSEAPETTGGKPLPEVGHRVSRIDMRTGRVTNFAINRSGFAATYTNAGGLERPIDVVFGPDQHMYVVDFGVNTDEEGYVPGSGVIWRIRKQ